MADPLFADWIIGLSAALLVGVALVATGRLTPTYDPYIVVLGGVGFAALVSAACFVAFRLAAGLAGL